MQYFLSIDYGGTNTKSIIFDRYGKQIAVSAFETLRQEPQPGYREVDLSATWEAICKSIKEVLLLSQIDSQQIAAIACIGHGKGLYVLDKQGQTLMNGILSTDSRATDLAQQFENQVQQLWPLTQQHIVAVQNPVLLRWLKEYQPEVYNNIGAILSAKDYVRFKLTGQINQEYGDASGNHWINFTTGQYDQQILKFFGIEEMWQALPPLVDCTAIVGGVSEDTAQQTGLMAGTPVVGGLFDIDACAIGSGVLNDNMFSVIAGTWNINTYPSQQAASMTSGQMNSYFPNKSFLVEASSPTSAGNLNAMLKLLMFDEIQNAKQKGYSIYDTLEEFLENTTASEQGLLFLPFLYGSNVAPDASSCFFGLTTMSTKSQMIRAVYEGIIFAHQQHIHQLIQSAGHTPQVIRLSGGATNSPAWMQMFADVLNIPVETVSATELGGLGGVIICLQALEGLTLEQAVNQVVHVKAHYQPNLEEYAIYQQKYIVYQQLLSALSDVWQNLAQLTK